MSEGYSGFLRDCNLTDEYIQQITHATPWVELNDDNLCVRESDIDGLGLFAKSLPIGSKVPMLDNGSKTEAGRFVNHSDRPNAEMVVVDDKNIDLITTMAVDNEELTINYRHSKGAQDVAKARANIVNLEGAMRGLDGYDEEGKTLCRITHYHAPGLYGREMWMPKDCLVVGKIHKTEHICVLSQGKITVADGGKTVTYEAPATIVSPVGAKRALYAHEDSVWTNFHATELQDPEEIEEEIIAKSFEELDGFLEHQERKRIS